MLRLDPGSRLGAFDLSQLRRHSFFEGLDWSALRGSEAPAWVEVEPESVGSAASSFDWELQASRGTARRRGLWARRWRWQRCAPGCCSAEPELQ